MLSGSSTIILSNEIPTFGTCSSTSDMDLQNQLHSILFLKFILGQSCFSFQIESPLVQLSYCIQSQFK